MLDEMGRRPRGTPVAAFSCRRGRGATREGKRHEAATRMVLITPEQGPSGLTSAINALEEQLADMRGELEALYRRIRAGELDELKNATRATAEIRQWLKIAIEMEAQLEKRRQHERGIVHGYAIDFAAARFEIRCRMDRLARARCAGRVPRCPERG